MGALNRFLEAIGRRQDVIFALFLILIVCMLILPLPTPLVDGLLAFSIGLSLLVLVAATYLRSVLDLSSFPAIILITTIFRLALTVSTTRLILTQGDAGHVIEAFGKFLVAGNVVVGLVVFLIIAIVQFIVVTKGAERIAEVSARFTLDALPGKQLSIDAEVRSGSLTSEQAKTKRMVLEKESQFFGAMDGAMRFVKGDAIAGLIIVFVNLLGGLMIGMFQKGMTFSDAAKKFSILSIGDGLVAQIPSMFIAIAAGAVVTRVINDDSRNLGADISKQLLAEPQALAIAAGALALIGILPGFPTSIFWGLGLIMAGSAFMLDRNAKRRATDKRAADQTATDEQAREDGQSNEPLPDAMPGDLYTVVVNPGTRQALFDGGLERILREGSKDLRIEMGFRYPTFGFRSDTAIQTGRLRVDVSDVPVGEITVHPMLGFSAASAAVLQDRGVQLTVTQRADGVQVLLVNPTEASKLSGLDIAPLTPIQMVGDDILASIRRHIAHGFGVNEAANWLTELQPKMGRLVQDVQQAVPILRIVDVGRRLLEEGHTLTQPRVILETLLRSAPNESDNEKLINAVRAALTRQIMYRATGGASTVPIIAISPEIEQQLRDIALAGPSAFNTPEPRGQEIVSQVRQLLSAANDAGDKPIITVTQQSRDLVRTFLNRRGVRTAVMSLDDFDENVTTRLVGVVKA
jgi:type III secretion protein V